MGQRHYSTCARPRAALRASCLCDISSASPPLTSTSTVRELTLALGAGLTATAAGNSPAAAASSCPPLRARASPAAKVFLERTGAVLVLRIWGLEARYVIVCDLIRIWRLRCGDEMRGGEGASRVAQLSRSCSRFVPGAVRACAQRGPPWGPPSWRVGQFTLDGFTGIRSSLLPAVEGLGRRRRRGAPLARWPGAPAQANGGQARLLTDERRVLVSRGGALLYQGREAIARRVALARRRASRRGHPRASYLVLRRRAPQRASVRRCGGAGVADGSICRWLPAVAMQAHGRVSASAVARDQQAMRTAEEPSSMRM